MCIKNFLVSVETVPILCDHSYPTMPAVWRFSWETQRLVRLTEERGQLTQVVVFRAGGGERTNPNMVLAGTARTRTPLLQLVSLLLLNLQRFSKVKKKKSFSHFREYCAAVTDAHSRSKLYTEQ